MKTIIIFTCIVITSLNCISQIKHDYTNVIIPPASGPASIQNNKWYKSIRDDKVIHIQFFNRNPIGIKKALELVEEICLNNSLDFDNPDKDNSYLASYVKSMDDFEGINLSVSSGSSIIEKSWYKQAPNGKTSMLRILLSEESYNVSVANFK